jgi:hypothetical protein
MRAICCTIALLSIAALGFGCYRPNPVDPAEEIQKLRLIIVDPSDDPASRASCVCIPGNCCCGDVGEPCHWCGGEHTC